MGTEFQVNTKTDSSLHMPEIVLDVDGVFVITWQSSGQDGSGLGVIARQYQSDGSPTGNEIQINTTTSGTRGLPDIALSATGAFVVSWRSSLQGGDSEGIIARRYDAGGMPSSMEFILNTTTALDQ